MDDMIDGGSVLMRVRWDDRAWEDFLCSLKLSRLVGAWFDVRYQIRERLSDFRSDPERLQRQISTREWDEMDVEILRDFIRADRAAECFRAIVADEYLRVVDDQIAKRELLDA